MHCINDCKMKHIYIRRVELRSEMSVVQKCLPLKMSAIENVCNLKRLLNVCDLKFINLLIELRGYWPN